jgi:hypothetical protein
MVVMAVVNVVLLGLSEAGILVFAWSWLVIVGTVGTIVLALGLSRVLGVARPSTVAAP